MPSGLQTAHRERIPLVTVVMCAYNHVDLTLTALKALRESKRYNSTAFEVVVVDDASTDLTPKELGALDWIRVLRLQTNQQFLRAANLGIQAARGRHVVLLNNDTRVVGCWLDPLIDTLRRHPDAGIVGSRLVNPDGTLQEAGGIVFSDGSAWNFGRGWRFDDPRATFERPVDYCSGASLLLSDRLLLRVPGFDERFRPAYYEDTDLCFTARTLGLSVWYQPRSIVVHLEGGSQGKSLTSGSKAAQVVNQKAFAEKWAAILGSQYPPGAWNVALARSRDRKRVVIVDWEVPTPDRDSGSHRLVHLIRAFLELDYAITLLTLKGIRSQPQTLRLEGMGVEVLGSPMLWSRHLKDIAPEVRLVWLSRPDVAEAALPLMRRWLPKAPVLYDTVDLHFVREQRRATVTGSRSAWHQARSLRKRELALCRHSDVVAVVSEREHEILTQLTGTHVVVLPNVHEIWKPPTEIDNLRVNILFVGGFRHLPNVDGMRWFLEEIWPRIHSAAPLARLRIVGPDFPSALWPHAAQGVDVVGWLPELDSEYATARVVVAPLRYGAGVKGKVGEALAHGVPVVVTKIAAEGLALIDGYNASVLDEPGLFASAVIDLIFDDMLWLERARLGGEALHGWMTPDTAKQALSALMAQVEGAGDCSSSLEAQILWRSRARRMEAALRRGRHRLRSAVRPARDVVGPAP